MLKIKILQPHICWRYFIKKKQSASCVSHEQEVLHVRASVLTPRLWTPPLVVWTRTRYFLPGVRSLKRCLVLPDGWEVFVTRPPRSSSSCRTYPSDTPRASCQLTCRLWVEWRSSTWSPVTLEGTEHNTVIIRSHIKPVLCFT